MEMELSDIKDKVAREFGYADYKEAKKKAYISKDLDMALDRVCELYADSRSRKAANEAVIEDRQWIKDNFENLVFYVEEIQNGEFRDVAKFVGVNRDLPFPEES